MSYRDLRSKWNIPASGSVFYHLKFVVLTSTISKAMDLDLDWNDVFSFHRFYRNDASPGLSQTHIDGELSFSQLSFGRRGLDVAC